MINILPTLMFLFFATNSIVLFDFNSDTSANNWKTVDDTVMGGRSDSEFYINSDGHAVFTGDISLKNYGGFCSVRYNFGPLDIGDFSKISIRLKGDGKDYKLRLKNTSKNYYSYQKDIETTGEWQNIVVDLSDFYPTFRGRDLDLPNFKHSSVEEFGILIANKKAEHFKLLIDKIEFTN